MEESWIPNDASLGTRLKSTSTPLLPLLFASRTLNVTRELSPPVLMISGVAETNCMLLVTGVATVIILLAVDPPATDAVIVSAPEQPLSLYVEIAIPELVLFVTGLVMIALPLDTQSEVKETEIGTVAGEPPSNTGTLTLLVP